MVAEVVLSVMGNRSDRRFPNLSCAWALEAVEVTRRKRADFHQGQERTMMLLKQAEYMAATASPSTRQSPFARGWVHIWHRKEPCAAAADIGLCLLKTPKASKSLGF
jgi:hypothetical protein